MGIRDKFTIRTKLRSAVHRVWPPRPRPLILAYHRIADEPVDPWSLAVSPLHFEEQLRILRRTRHPLPLKDFVNRLNTGTLPRNAVALTFDDGYVDNLIAGKPRLAAADVPATVFLATGYLGRSEPFWSDELARLVLLGKNPPPFDLVVRDEAMHFDLASELRTHEDGVTAIAPMERRHNALRTIWEALRRVDEEERRPIMVRLRSIFGELDERTKMGRAMTGDEVQALVADGLVTIGAHTATHPVLVGMEAAACQREISESKLACEALTGAPVSGFAYPYGDFDAGTREAVKAAGLSFACSTQHRSVVPTSDLLALPRFYVPNIDGDAFESALRRFANML